MRTVAVILTRLPAALLLPLAGRPVLEHAVAACENATPVSEILVVTDPTLAVQVRRQLAGRGYRKMAGVLEGGPTRAHDVMTALAAIGEPDCHVLIHDAAYPLVTTAVIEECAAALETHGCVCAVAPASDTMVGVENDIITVRPARDRLRRRQSPQGFHLLVLRQAYQAALAGIAVADLDADACALVLRHLPGVTVGLVPVGEGGLKITAPEDVALAEAVLAAGPH